MKSLKTLKKDFWKSDWLDVLIIDLEENNENGRVEQIKKIQEGIQKKKDKNEKEVLSKINELVKKHNENKPLDAKETLRLEESKARAKIKKDFIEGKVKLLKSKILSIKKPSGNDK